ncbi:hypothetical protein X474_25195 [Dethiosulfatarculus sandiegensis]|uniref:Uncharacterized protein n=1 Tax=Dethiosulfatarculus sandiegensis TaxID=1429043 RepID=A0A0D2J652_9BACT|nr:hypothetical protein X474_25195 [Dethiosulfatarculus sandiegensis]
MKKFRPSNFELNEHGFTTGLGKHDMHRYGDAESRFNHRIDLNFGRVLFNFIQGLKIESK